MRYHEPHPIAGIIGVITALCVAAGSTHAQSMSPSVQLPPGSTGAKPHNEQGRVSSDGAAKTGGPRVDDDYSLRMIAGGLGPVQTAIGSGRDGFDTQLYIVRQTTSQVVKVNPVGQKTHFADLSPIAPAGGCSWPVFDFFGDFGGSLYVQDPMARTTNVDPAGNASVFSINEVIDAVGTMEFDRSGAFGGSLFISDSLNGKLYSMTPAGQVDLVATGVGSARGIAITSGPRGGDAMFISDPTTARITMVTPAHAQGAPAYVFSHLGMTAPGVRGGSLEYSKYGPFGRGILIVGDTTTGRIVQLDGQGRRVGELASGFKNLASIEIAWSGVFAGKMIITANGCVYAVTPRCRADWNGDQALTTSDLSDFMADFADGDADFTGDGMTNNDDLTFYFAAFSAGCQ